MTAKFIEKLLSIGGPALAGQPPVINLPGFNSFGTLAQELLHLLEVKNGFYAFESALHIFPAAHFDGPMTLSRWNAHGIWKYEYQGIADARLFFAEEGFGNQFCIFRDQIWFFDAETGDMDFSADNLDAWAKKILTNYNIQTGYPLVHEWQKRNGPLQAGHRLMPKMPFVLGGKYELENLYSLKAISAMRTRGNLANQIKSLPDGTKIKIRVID